MFPLHRMDASFYCLRPAHLVASRHTWFQLHEGAPREDQTVTRPNPRQAFGI